MLYWLRFYYQPQLVGCSKALMRRAQGRNQNLQQGNFFVTDKVVGRWHRAVTSNTSEPGVVALRRTLKSANKGGLFEIDRLVPYPVQSCSVDQAIRNVTWRSEPEPSRRASLRRSAPGGNFCARLGMQGWYANERMQGEIRRGGLVSRVNAWCPHSSMSCLRSRVAIAASCLPREHCSPDMAHRAPRSYRRALRQATVCRCGARRPSRSPRTADISWVTPVEG
jgi:hypothetical protein